ncbi:MAG: chloride channel protein [Lachnospiraceae bacterium]|nr:chloride channel protein [Lachnospiraceae bacterium]
MVKALFKNLLISLKGILKWLLMSFIVGILVGLVMSGFDVAVEYVTHIRSANQYLIWFLPLAGLFIVFVYRKCGLEDVSTSTVIVAIREQKKKISLKLAPLILAATVLTHLFGGSTGREGAALQFGGSVGNHFARRLKMKPSNSLILMMAAMSASFSALFGTPLAAAIFPMEFVSIGVIYYAALVPCVLSSFVANSVVHYFGLRTLGNPYLITGLPSIYSPMFLKTILIGILCALVGILFCEVMYYGHEFAKKAFPNSYVRVLVGGVAIVLLTLLIGSQTYNGLSSELITRSFEGTAPGPAFLLKMLFTVLTLGFGFKGGEIVPTFVIGSTFGCFIAGVLGVPAELGAACCMCGVFCAVTNCPIASLMIAFELFGFEGMAYFAIVVAISYMLSGYGGLYNTQKIVYSKYEPRFVNKTVREYFAHEFVDKAHLKEKKGDKEKS